MVEGNVNEITKNQIHYKEEGGGIQLSKRSNDNKLNNITSGSSEGGGDKEYYYKYNYSEELDPSQIVNNFVIIEVLYGGLNDEVIPLNKKFTNYGVIEPLTILIDRYCVAIKISDSGVIYYTYNSDMPFMVIPKGSIVDKLLYLAKKSGLPEDQIEEYINAINNVFEEITKEEYESMITYKPE